MPERPHGGFHDGFRTVERAQFLLEIEAERLAATCVHDVGGLAAGAEEPCDALALSDGRVGEGEMRLGIQALAVHDQGDVVHVDGLAREGPLDEGLQVDPRFAPDVEEGAAERIPVLVPQDGPVGFVVEQRQRGAPNGEHGLLGAEHDPDQRPQGDGPGARGAQRRARPIEGAHAPDHRVGAMEGVLIRHRHPVSTSPSRLRLRTATRR